MPRAEGKGARPAWGGGGEKDAHLRVLAPHVPAHGGPGGHLGPAQLAALRLDLVVGELYVLLQHVLGDVFLVTHGARPLLAHFTQTRTHTRRKRQAQALSEAVPQPAGQAGRVLLPRHMLPGWPPRSARDQYDWSPPSLSVEPRHCSSI